MLITSVRIVRVCLLCGIGAIAGLLLLLSSRGGGVLFGGSRVLAIPG